VSWANLRQQLLDDSHALVDSTTVDRKIAEALRFHKANRLWFSERTFQFGLVAGQSAYTLGNGPPANLAEVVGRTIYILIGGSTDQRMPCTRIPSQRYDSLRMFGITQSQPVHWDFFGNQMRFYPTPISSDDVVEGRYVVDIGVPQVKYNNNSSVYEFYHPPDGVRLMSSAELAAFENDWTDMASAGHMVMARAAYYLYSQTLKDPDAAESWLNAWLEQKALLDDETEALTAGATEIAGCLLD
jgi:hypothetical protein